jgi:hypothetical protein
MKTIYTPKRNLFMYGRYLAIMAGILLTACYSPKQPEKLQATLFNDPGKYGLTITTNSEMAQRFFN